MKDKRTALWKYGLYTLTFALAIGLVVGAVGRGPVFGEAGGKSAASAHELSNAFVGIADAASPGVVSIQVEKEMAVGRTPLQGIPGMPEEFFDFFFGPRGPRNRPVPKEQGGQRRSVPFGQGSGFILSRDGYIVTNNHVVGDADTVKVKLLDGREFDAEIVGTDPQTEVALIKVDATDLPALPLGDSDELRVGEWVLAIGNPFGLSHTVTGGIVSALGRGNVGVGGKDFYANFIQTDAAINMGNSGGPLMNLDGEVVGMNTAIYSRTGGSVGIGFAIPVNMVKYIEGQLREDGKVTRGFLGVLIQTVTPDLRQWFGLEQGGSGILIADVTKDSPAEKAGLQRDDVILELDGQPVDDVGSFRSRIATTGPGTKVELLVLRDGKRIQKTVKVGSLDADTPTVSTSAGAYPKLGLTVQNLTDDIAKRLGYEDLTGVVVSEVAPGSAAAEAGIESGTLIQEVNRKRVKNTREFQSALDAVDAEKGVLFLIHDGEYSRYVALRFQ